ncbi:MAG: hypothetical protein LBQ37_00770 [Elusimicrobiota bacterium]|nr:hypothetical protein [Elusimicrobiota bacterium]
MENCQTNVKRFNVDLANLLIISYGLLLSLLLQSGNDGAYFYVVEVVKKSKKIYIYLIIRYNWWSNFYFKGDRNESGK